MRDYSRTYRTLRDLIGPEALGRLLCEFGGCVSESCPHPEARSFSVCCAMLAARTPACFCRAHRVEEWVPPLVATARAAREGLDEAGGCPWTQIVEQRQSDYGGRGVGIAT